MVIPVTTKAFECRTFAVVTPVTFIEDAVAIPVIFKLVTLPSCESLETPNWFTVSFPVDGIKPK